MMKPKSGDKGAGEAITPSLHSHVGTSGKNVVIPGSSVMARRSANIQKANDGSLIYRRRNSMSSASAVTPESKGADALVQTRSQGKDASRSRMSLPIETRSDRKRPADSDLSQSMSVPKRRRTIRNTADGTCVESDAFCWICHRDGQGVCCELCPRLYHIKCLGIEQPSKEWICPECEKVMIAENTETRSKAMSMLSMETLCTLLKFVLQRMKYPETDPFHRPVDCALIPTYTDFIFNAMDFSTLEKNIKKKAYGSTEAFVADVKWILHNCIVFNGKKHRLTNIAKTILKVCRHETNEIEVCPDCYMNSCVKPSENWFCQPCRTPHILVWAKMKGYPFWPAKVLREDKGLIDVRFFGEHDRAWVPVSQIFMMSEEPPTSLKNRKGFEPATEELRKHIALLREKFGSFTYAAHRTPYDPNNPYSKVNLSTSPQSKPPVFRPKRITKSKPIMKVRNVDESKKGVKIFISKIADKPTSITKKTASAVRLKYNSIISTRMISAKKNESSAQEAAPRTTNTEVLESGCAADVEKMVQSKSDVASMDGITTESNLDGLSPTSTARMECLQDDQNASLSSSERNVKELEIGSKVKLDLDVNRSENSSKDTSNKSESVEQPPVCITLSEKNEASTDAAASGVLTSGLDVSEKDGPLGNIHLNCDNVTLQTSKETRAISHDDDDDQPVIQDASCSSSTGEIQSDHASGGSISIHCDPCKNSDSVCAGVVEITGGETVVDCGESTSQIEKSECDIDLPVESSGACKSTLNAEERIVPTLEELPEVNVPSDSLKSVLSAQSITKDGLVGDVKKDGKRALEDVICESEERQANTLEAVSQCLSISSDAAGFSLDNNTSSIKDPVLESGAACLESSSVQPASAAAATETSLATSAVDGILPVIEAAHLTVCESDIKLVSAGNDSNEVPASADNDSNEVPASAGNDSNEAPASADNDSNEVPVSADNDSNEVSALKTPIPASSIRPSSVAASYVSESDSVEWNCSPVKSDAAIAVDCLSDMPGGLDSSILQSLATDIEERSSEMDISRSVESPPTTSRVETSANTRVASLSSQTDTNAKLSSDCQQNRMLAREVSGLNAEEREGNADDLLMEVDCEDDASSVVVIDDDIEESFGSNNMKIKDVKSLQPTKNLLGSSSRAKNGEEPTQMGAAVASSLGQTLPLLQNFSQPKTQSFRSPYLANVLSKPPTQTTSHNLPCFPMRNRVLTVSGTSNQSSVGAAISSQSSASGSAAMCQSLLLNAGTSNPDIGGNSADPANASGASSFEFNIEGFDYSKYTSKMIDSTRNMLQEFCQDMVNAEVGSAVRKHLQLELDRMHWRHEQELKEMRLTADIQLAELRLALEHDKEFSLSEQRQKYEEEKKKEIEEIKKKQWCANCGREAIFYCCWNTSYCNYPCQQTHWPKHMLSCTQALEGSQSHDEQAATSQPDDRGTMNVPSNQQQKWKGDNPDLSINAALKQQELDRQIHYLSNQTRTLPSIQISSTNNLRIGVHQQPTPPVVHVQYSAAAAYSSSSVRMATPYLSNSQQPVSLLHPQQQFRLRANQMQQQQPGPIIMYPGVQTAVLTTTRHGTQTIPIGSIPPAPIYQPKKY